MRSLRLEEMESYIRNYKTVTLDQLCNVFGVSKNTVRRDIEEITAGGEIKKIYGGVTVESRKELIPFSERNIANLEAKKAIAQKAAQLVEDGDIIFLDSGTTTCPMVEYLKDKNKITLLTHNLQAVIAAIPYDNINVICLPGTLNRKTLSFTGADGVALINMYNINKAFMSATGVSLAGGATNSSAAEFNIKQAVVGRSQQINLLADHSKWDIVSLMTYAPLEQIDNIITDVPPPRDIAAVLEEHAHQYLLAGSATVPTPVGQQSGLTKK